MKKAKNLIFSITGSCLALFLAGCLTPSPKSAKAPSGIRSIQMPSKAATASMHDRGVNAAANSGGWTSSSKSVPPVNTPANAGQDYQLDQAEFGATAGAETEAKPPEPELAGGAPTPDQLAREYEAMNAPPKPEPIPEPTSYAPTPIDPVSPSVNLPPTGTPSGPAPFQGSVAVDPAPSAEPVIPSVEDIANQYRALQTAP